MAAAQIPPPAEPGSGVASGFRMGRTVSALILREMASRYGRSPGGYVWAILEPIAIIAIMSAGISLLVRTPPIGTSFILFYGTGFAPFGFYQNLSLTVSRALIYSSALLSYPIINWVDAVIARFILNTLTGIMVLYLVLSGIVLTLESPIILDIRPIMIGIFLCALLGAGIGLLNCALIGLITIWDKVWSIFTRPLFLLSGVILLYEDMPPMVQTILWYNPLMHIIGLIREGFYPTYEASYFSGTYVIAISLLTMFFGVVLLYRYHREILTN